MSRHNHKAAPTRSSAISPRKSDWSMILREVDLEASISTLKDIARRSKTPHAMTPVEHITLATGIGTIWLPFEAAKYVRCDIVKGVIRLSASGLAQLLETALFIKGGADHE